MLNSLIDAFKVPPSGERDGYMQEGS
jgi:hypothetical protein